MWTFPADPALPEELHGRRMVLVAAVYAGDPADADDVLAPFRQLATPLIDMSATMPYVTVQSDFDAVFPDGGRYYFKSHMMDELTDAAIAAVVRCANARANEESFIVIRTLGGAISRVSPEDSAYPHRAANFNVSIDCVWSDSGDDDAIIGWARQTWDAVRPFASGGVYLNFAGFDDERDVTPEQTLGPNLDRLERIRSQYDPDGVFEEAARRP